MEDTTTRILPHEILSQIFDFLPLADRKSVRLACRSWYDCCTCAKITKREKFVFQSGFHVEDIADVILCSKHSLLDLEFQGLPVNYIPASAWEECGKQIRKLELYNCLWNDETVSNIVLHCENLTSLVVSNTFGNNKRHIPYSPRLLHVLNEKGICRPNLVTLSVFIGSSDEYESILRKIFLIHPRIKHLSIRSGHLPLELDQLGDSDTRLESLTYNVLTDGKWMEALVDKAEQGFRLKHLESRIICKSSMKGTIFDFFKAQRNLEVIRLFITCIDHPDEMKEFFYHILESCPYLREFGFKTYPLILMDLKPSEVQRFFTSISKLNFLMLSFSVEGSEYLPGFSYPLTNPIQLNLRSLKWDWSHSRIDPAFFTSLFQRCSSLQHLHLAECWDSTLQAIFQYLMGLQKLIVNDMSRCTHPFTGRDDHSANEGHSYSIKRLQQLTYLELHAMTAEAAEMSAREIQLPRLKFLSLRADSFKGLSEEELNHCASHLSELRVLSIIFIINSFKNKHSVEKMLIQFYKQLDNLDRLIFQGDYYFGKRCTSEKGRKLIESIFSACRRLRYISWTDRWMFIRDPSTGKALCKDGRIFKFPGNIFENE